LKEGKIVDGRGAENVLINASRKHEIWTHASRHGFNKGEKFIEMTGCQLWRGEIGYVWVGTSKKRKGGFIDKRGA